MKNALILLILLVVLGLIPAMVLRNDHTAMVRGYLPVEMGSMEYHWVYLKDQERVLDSTTIAAGRFKLQAEVGTSQIEALLLIPDCGVQQPLTLRPGKEIELRISLDEYYRQRAEWEIIETRARLDENGLSLPDSVWSELRDVLIERYLKNKHKR